MFGMKVIYWLAIIYIVFTYQIIATDDNMQLMLVQMIYRHGDRSPLSFYPNDPNPKSAFPEGKGKLTLLGKRQHYDLGLLLRSLYGNFMTTAPTEVNVTSADCYRCIESAESNLASFFAPSDAWKFRSDVNWQPIPVQFTPNKDDKLFALDNKCPAADADYMKIFVRESEKILAQHKHIFDYLTLKSGMNISNVASAAELYDTMKIEKKHNLTVPDWIDPYWGVLEYVANTMYAWAFNTTTLKRLHGGPLLKLMINRMKAKINGDIPDLKFEVFSGHDTNVALMLECLNFRVLKTIPYAATLILELYNGPKNSNSVRVLILNSTSDDKYHQTPHILHLDGCSEFCPLDTLIGNVQPFIPDDWEKECGFSQS